ncbi:hypothetical protein KDA_30670 [Dictyobacter alpinus]|uniref:Uncharacterized protein n=1 Tax=Dictyobacter alpinus TaxID=2014873 RepID=A0A402B846_9CHLR|nr:hypothetical protein KDA_30670 [Dictyobacter alpinus]
MSTFVRDDVDEGESELAVGIVDGDTSKLRRSIAPGLVRSNSRTNSVKLLLRSK